MSFVGKNIRKIRTVKKLSQAAFAELFGLARPSVGAYEEGRSEPKMETLIQIAQHFGLSVDLLLTKELTVNELYHFDIFQEQLQQPAPAPSPVAPAEHPQNVTPLVYRNRALEYIVHHHDPAFVDALPWLQLPHQLTGPTRAFEVSGADMLLHRQGLRHQDIVLCSRVDKAQPRLKTGNVYVFVTPGKLLIRRLIERLENDQLLKLRADNPDYGSQELALSQALEIWEVRGVFTTHLRAPALLDERVAELERKVEELFERGLS
ncbi:LexA family transcriptional regulator [Hymenobacter sp. BT770]|uniref:XRE family transcriptional regulator n=1 Tax=Hymenobacter sp. BT770 TaxID=2886942 RepID=UPI001D118519|nr:LexA family transcriptional regulator [Hymenobacter sp. BT770]MCC3155514.1 LexA family transcriptional regulator [Hymenobacter sp. BT770]MDO3417518.1 LexA family transcriptional regulator [Hymenobacter sp. BT770]